MSVKSTQRTSERVATAKPAPNPDVASVSAVVLALYESVSFVPGMQPDYSRLKALFHPEAHIVPPRTEKDEAITVLDVESFLTRSRDFVVTTGLERKGFHEKEIARRTEAFGSLTHVFSTYESRFLPTDARPMQRGINSIQLVREGGRWWVISIAWDVERPNNPIPAGFLV